MVRLGKTVLAGVAITAVACLPAAPAFAAGPLFFAPWALSHIVAPLIIGAVTSAAQPRPAYPAGPGYYGGAAGYYPSPGYVRPPGYYPAAPGYYAAAPGYYGPAPGYYASAAGYYGRGYSGPAPYGWSNPRGYSQRGVYAQRLPYHASYGGHEAYRSGGSGHRGW
jgi:hypothetical protein